MKVGFFEVSQRINDVRCPYWFDLSVHPANQLETFNCWNSQISEETLRNVTDDEKKLTFVEYITKMNHEYLILISVFSKKKRANQANTFCKTLGNNDVELFYILAWNR